MFTTAISVLEERIGVLVGVTETNRRVLDAIADERDETHLVGDIRKVAPDASAWRLFDSSAAVMWLYAAYEAFVHDLVSVWLGVLPELYGNYSDLPKSVLRTHRTGWLRSFRSPEANAIST